MSGGIFMRKTSFKRTTKETDIHMELDPDMAGSVNVATTVPFLDHLLTAMAFHGRFSLAIKATGDTEVDPHHLVEDTGLVLGEILSRILEKNPNVSRFASALIPMDEALAEVVIDICGRPTLVYNSLLPQERVGDFDLSLIREFYIALSSRARISLHINMRYGENSHHLVEAAFKALGKAIKQAYSLEENSIGISTKGII